jgi:hypothetical protein
MPGTQANKTAIWNHTLDLGKRDPAMSSGIARSIGTALFLFCLGVTAYSAPAKSAVPSLRPRVCPRACRVHAHKGLQGVQGLLSSEGLSPGQCRTVCGETILEARSRCKDAANPTPPSCA